MHDAVMSASLLCWLYIRRAAMLAPFRRTLVLFWSLFFLLFYPRACLMLTGLLGLVVLALSVLSLGLSLPARSVIGNDPRPI
jgi:uncharacterized membrane protein